MAPKKKAPPKKGSKMEDRSQIDGTAMDQDQSVFNQTNSMRMETGEKTENNFIPIPTGNKGS
jgi:hypothetical protein